SPSEQDHLRSPFAYLPRLPPDQYSTAGLLLDASQAAIATRQSEPSIFGPIDAFLGLYYPTADLVLRRAFAMCWNCTTICWSSFRGGMPGVVHNSTVPSIILMV